jgi:hypothetical protein
MLLGPEFSIAQNPGAKAYCCYEMWQKLHSHAYTHAMVCSFVSFTHYLIYLRRQIAKKIRLWRCLLHCSFPPHSW